ncbi:3-ketoacyl-CoA synthase 1 [Hibiscus syriacus]|uniref:3-ketoacyl-CoA synthase n=1 Tax=Hibiscus syriacus TaxID=106335 RepID=A0A6A2ZH88_HIBSY|nr:3-ketoacyl-CoA synthase 1 [Hibiscus syriacus]
MVIILAYFPTFLIQGLVHEIFNHLKTITVFSFSLVFLAILHFKTRPAKVYLLNFACYKPKPDQSCSKEHTLLQYRSIGIFSEESLAFQKKIIEKSGLGEKTYFPKGLMTVPLDTGISEAINETEDVICGAIDEVLKKTGIKSRDIGIVVVNSSLFNPVPSLSAMIVNRFKLRDDVLSYSLAGMGCSAGVIAIDVPNNCCRTYGLVLSTENLTHNPYFGNNRAMLLTNCLFRVGGAAIILSNHPSDRRRSKYELLHTFRTNVASNDASYKCVHQEEDEQGTVGIALSKNLMAVAGEALKKNISTLAPFVLPLSQQLLVVASMVAKKFFKKKVYIPDFKLAFEHFCIHAGGKTVLDELQKSLKLGELQMEPSRMTLYRFGNTSSSSLWYELAYCEAKGRVNNGDRVWQIGFGSGFKCNSMIWKALKRIDPLVEKNPWTDEILDFPVLSPLN